MPIKLKFRLTFFGRNLEKHMLLERNEKLIIRLHNLVNSKELLQDIFLSYRIFLKLNFMNI